MKVVVIGSGAREHALAYKISQSSLVDKVYALPGNVGISTCAQCVAIEDLSGIAQFCVDNNIDLVFVGPEAFLAKGIVDTLRAKGVKVVGPDMKASILESSKIWAKKFMNKYAIPSSRYEVISNKEDLRLAYKNFTFPLVVKMDELCAGKGVFICESEKDLEEVCSRVYKSAEKGPKVIVEEFIKGRELSFMFFTDGQDYIEIASSKDYKKIYDGDMGPNTGGMGAYSPANINDDEYKKIIDNVVVPTINGIKSEGLDYKGVVYAGLMIDEKSNIHVLEYNVRFGDPETQAILMRMDFDIMDILVPLASGNLPKNYKAKWSDKTSVCVVLAQDGYPGKCSKGVLIDKLKDYKEKENMKVFHAGTSKKEDGNFYTSGGRILSLCALGGSKKIAREVVYNEIDKIKWDEAIYRKDIASE